MRALPSRKLNKRITRVWRLSATVNLIIWTLIALVPVGIAWATFGGLDGLDSTSRPSRIVASTASGSQAVTELLSLVCIGMAVLFVILFIVFVVIVPKIRWIQWSFEVYDEEIDIHKGIFWHKRIIIPLIRVQNVDTRQGPIMRANGLASFTVATAAGEHEIPGLEVAEADALRDHVAVLARIAQEDV
jgi:membrane protein YdbS with pleckstrin-like domain